MTDSFEAADAVQLDLDKIFNWYSSLPDFKWSQIHGGSRIYRDKDHNGLWAIRGHRIYEFDVVLVESPGYEGALVSLECDEETSPLVRELEIDNLAGPFASDKMR